MLVASRGVRECDPLKQWLVQQDKLEQQWLHHLALVILYERVRELLADVFDWWADVVDDAANPWARI